MVSGIARPLSRTSLPITRLLTPEFRFAWNAVKIEAGCDFGGCRFHHRFFFLMMRRPPRSTQGRTLFPYTTLPADLKKVVDETMAVACVQHRQDEVKAEADGLAQMKARGMQVNDVKDLRPFQERAQPVWKFLEDKVGKELFDRVITEAKAAAK